jgi:hypothetical protein
VQLVEVAVEPGGVCYTISEDEAVKTHKSAQKAMDNAIILGCIHDLF